MLFTKKFYAGCKRCLSKDGVLVTQGDKRLRRQPERVIAGRYAKAGRFKARYWTPSLQGGALALPRFTADLVTLRRNPIPPWLSTVTIC